MKNTEPTACECNRPMGIGIVLLICTSILAGGCLHFASPERLSTSRKARICWSTVRFGSIKIESESGPFFIDPSISSEFLCAENEMCLSLVIRNTEGLPRSDIERCLRGLAVRLHTSDGCSTPLKSISSSDEYRESPGGMRDDTPDFVILYYTFGMDGNPLGDACIEFAICGIEYRLSIPYGIVWNTVNEDRYWTPPRSGRSGLDKEGNGSSEKVIVEWISTDYGIGTFDGWKAVVSFQRNCLVCIHMYPHPFDVINSFEDIRDLDGSPTCSVSIQSPYIGQVNGFCESIVIDETKPSRMDSFSFPKIHFPRRTLGKAVVKMNGRESSFSIPSSLFEQD